MKKHFLFILFLLNNLVIYSQVLPTGDNFLQNVTVPISPEASALTKFGGYGASLYSGTPNIEIPLGAVSGREFQIPINLVYDASGIKVNQMATWVGLG
jgi:hypothetical protein